MAEPVKFFGAVDRERKSLEGKILSAYPAWYYEEKTDRMKDDITVRKNRLDSGKIPADRLEEERNTLGQRQLRLKMIIQSKPKLTDKQKDDVYKFYCHLKDQIINRLPTRSDIKKGTVNIKEEVMWKKKPSIDVTGFAIFCDELNFPILEGRKISGHQAMAGLKIIGKLLGEDHNIERLRRDFNTGTYRPETSLDELVKQGT